MGAGDYGVGVEELAPIGMFPIPAESFAPGGSCRQENPP